MLFDWLEATITTLFAIVNDITSEMKLIAYKCSLNSNQVAILYVYNNSYIVPSSKSVMSTLIWFDFYKSSQ